MRDAGGKRLNVFSHVCFSPYSQIRTLPSTQAVTCPRAAGDARATAQRGRAQQNQRACVRTHQVLLEGVERDAPDSGRVAEHLDVGRVGDVDNVGGHVPATGHAGQARAAVVSSGACAGVGSGGVGVGVGVGVGAGRGGVWAGGPVGCGWGGWVSEQPRHAHARRGHKGAGAVKGDVLDREVEARQDGLEAHVGVREQEHLAVVVSADNVRALLRPDRLSSDLG